MGRIIRNRKSKVKVLVTQSHLTLAIPWTVACQAPLSMGFSSQEYWSGLHSLLHGIFPIQGIEPRSPALQADSLPPEPPGKSNCSSNLDSISVKILDKFFQLLSLSFLTYKIKTFCQLLLKISSIFNSLCAT